MRPDALDAAIAAKKTAVELRATVWRDGRRRPASALAVTVDAGDTPATVRSYLDEALRVLRQDIERELGLE